MLVRRYTIKIPLDKISLDSLRAQKSVARVLQVQCTVLLLPSVDTVNLFRRIHATSSNM